MLLSACLQSVLCRQAERSINDTSVQSILVVMTVRVSPWPVALTLLSAALQRTAQGVQSVWVMTVILAFSYSQLLATFQQRTARDVLSVFVVMTDHISH